MILAEAEAGGYAADVAGEHLGLAQVYALVDEPGHGSELFSLLRDSQLQPVVYLDAFFDTGDESAGLGNSAATSRYGSPASGFHGSSSPYFTSNLRVSHAATARPAIPPGPLRHQGVTCRRFRPSALGAGRDGAERAFAAARWMSQTTAVGGVGAGLLSWPRHPSLPHVDEAP